MSAPKDQASDAEAVAAAQSLSSQAAQLQFKSALNQVTESLNSIRNDFDIVKSSTTGLPSIPGTGSLQKDWEKLCQQYTNIRWDIKDVATQVATFAEQIGTIYLPSVAGPSEGEGDGIVEWLTSFQKAQAALGEKTLQKVKDFNELKGSLNKFQKKYDEFYISSGSKQASEVATLTGEINAHYECLDSINAQIQSLVTQQYSTFFKRNKWILAVPGVGGIALIVDMIQDSRLKTQIQALKREYEQVWSKIRTKKVELDKASSNSATISKLKVTIDTLTDGRFKDVIGGLNIFNEVKTAGDEDVKELKAYQERGRQGTIPLSLIIYNQTQTSVYGGIISGLHAFVIGVTR